MKIACYELRVKSQLLLCEATNALVIGFLRFEYIEGHKYIALFFVKTPKIHRFSFLGNQTERHEKLNVVKMI